jgi:hypothetical protein
MFTAVKHGVIGLESDLLANSGCIRYALRPLSCSQRSYIFMERNKDAVKTSSVVL